jgi:hypothetical protein
MKKIIYFSIAIIVLLLVGGMPVLYASGVHGGGHGSYGGHYGRGHGGYYGRGHGCGVIWIGPGWWDPWWDPLYYPYYSEPPYVIQQQAPVYEQQTPVEEQQNYWYFCPDSKAYYPYVKQCPGGWLKVVPTQGPPK